VIGSEVIEDLGFGIADWAQLMRVGWFVSSLANQQTVHHHLTSDEPCSAIEIRDNPMQVTVRLFATLRQQAGWKEKAVELPAQATVADLMGQLAQAYPTLNLSGRTLYSAVNEEYVKPDRLLADGDEVAFFPPVSGGAYPMDGEEDHARQEAV
jgi:molybdopterin synthase catalytic subunit